MLGLGLVAATAMGATAQTVDTLAGGIVRYDDYRAPDGFMAFWPSDSLLAAREVTPSGEPLGLVVFTHGYGALNPLNYGAWLRHLVAAGNVVLYPRYQRNLWQPSSRAFAKTAAAGLAAGLAWLTTETAPTASLDDPIYIGHSYGGVITAYLLAHQDSLGLPAGFGALLVAPGTSRLKGSRLDSYAAIAPATQLLIVSHAGDELVGDEFARLVFETVDPTTAVAWLQQRADTHGGLRLGQGHNECYALDEAFDTGLRNFNTRRALRIGCTDDLDLALFWPLVDELLAARADARPHALLDERPGGYALGTWPDGTPRRPVALVYRTPASQVPHPPPAGSTAKAPAMER